MKLMNQGQEKENNSELLNNNLRFNYSSQPILANSLNFPSRSNIIRIKDAPVHYDKKKIQPQPIQQFEPRVKSSLDVTHKYRTNPLPEVASRTENDNYTEEYAAGLY